MNRFKYHAYIKEFPFMEEICSGYHQDCDGILVKKMTPEIFGLVPEFYSWSGSLVEIAKGECVSFVTESEIIKDAVAQKSECGSNYAYSETQHEPGETVLEAIDRLAIGMTVKFIVVVEFGYDTVDHYSTDNWRATIYKPAKGISILALIEAAKDAATHEVRAESNF